MTFRSDVGQAVTLTYTNHRGETADRTITPTGRMVFGSNEWHPEPQWLVEAHDARSGEVRLFAFEKFGVAPQHVRNPYTLLKGAAAPRTAMSYQDRVSVWQYRIVHDDPTDLAERAHRFTEEAMELTRSLGQTRDEARQLVDYVHDQDHIGEPAAEAGGTQLTFAALCILADLNMARCAEAELDRVSTPEMVAKIREKRSKRHGRGPLPGIYAPDFTPTTNKPGREGQEEHRCFACNEAFQPDDLVLEDASGGTIHRACCGPDRDGFTGADGGPLKEDEPIPSGWPYRNLLTPSPSPRQDGKDPCV